MVQKLSILTAHSYIAKVQAKYLKKCKEELKEIEAIVLGDFSENYKFVIQDEIQGFYWNNSGSNIFKQVNEFRISLCGLISLWCVK